MTNRPGHLSDSGFTSSECVCSKEREVQQVLGTKTDSWELTAPRNIFVKLFSLQDLDFPVKD